MSNDPAISNHTAEFKAQELDRKVAKAAKVVGSIPGFVNEVVERSNLANDIGAANHYVWDRLNTLGIYHDSDSYDILMSSDCPEGDARHVFCENGTPNLPIARFKRVWSILKECDKGQVPDAPDHWQVPDAPDHSWADALSKIAKTMRPVGQITDDELMAMYGEKAPDDVVDELHKRSNGRPFVVYKSEIDGLVDCEASLRMLREARRRATPTFYKFADTLKVLWCAGEFPGEVYEECPLHPDVLLVDGFCDQCGHTWEGVTEMNRQFVRVVRDNGRAPDDGPSIRQMIDSSMLKSSELGTPPIVQDYPKDWVDFQRMVEENRLPSLKRRMSIPTGVGRQDPFKSGNRRS